MAMQEFTALEYIKLDVAGHFGLDKEDWNVRLGWFETNQHDLDELAAQADSPAQYYAAVQAYRDVLAGEPIGHTISLDATSSGIQLLAIMTGCRTSAMQCNVVDVGHRQDAYTNNYHHMLALLGEEGNKRINRKMTKDALMTAMYNSVARPRDIFGEGTVLLDAFYKSVGELFPGAWELTQAMLGTWQPDAYSHDWVLPDNFHVHAKVMGTTSLNVHLFNQPHEVTLAVNKPMDEGRSNGANLTHSVDGMVVREVVNRCMFSKKRASVLKKMLTHTGKSTSRKEDTMVIKLWDHYEKSGFLSSRILNYLDSLNMGHVDATVIATMLDSLPETQFPVLTVHDCFRVHPNYGNDLRRQYNQVLHDLAKSDILSYCVSQIVGYGVKVEKREDFADEILEASYALS